MSPTPGRGEDVRGGTPSLGELAVEVEFFLKQRSEHDLRTGSVSSQ
jgi:hypothetical protein